MTSLTQDIMDLVDNAWMAHIQDWAAFEGPSPINITAVRMAGYLWLSYLRVPGQSWKPLTHCTYVDTLHHVFWNTRDKAWEVKMNFHGKTLYGGYLKPKDSTPEAVECARLAAAEKRRELEQKHYQESEAPLHPV